MTGIEHHLNVYIGNSRIATLSRPTDKLMWQYTPEWQEKGFPVSPHLPFNSEIASLNIERFLRNLLPEGAGLEELLGNFHLSSNNTIGLIHALGQDIPGAMLVLDANQYLPETAVFRPIMDSELEERLKHREEVSLIIWDGKPRLSSAGVQDKINVMLNEENELGFGEGSLCSTHILKFEKNKSPHLVLNEYVTMQLAKLCGLNVADVELKNYGDYFALLVSRFDRKYLSRTEIMRRHIIDGCQALNLPPDYKYERNWGSGRDVAHIRDGASFEKLFQFANQCTNPAKTKLDMLDWALFNLIVCNSDAHAKNVSFFVNADGMLLAPFYDLVNIKLYPQFDQEMAMAYGDEFLIDEIDAYQLAGFAEKTQLDRRLVAQRLDSLVTKLLRKQDEVFSVERRHHSEQSFLAQYQKIIQDRCARLMNQAKLLPKMVL